MQKKTILTPSQLSEIISQIEYQIFDEIFYVKYGLFFDSLIQKLLSSEISYREEFARMINGIILFWDNPEKLHYLYEATTCDLLYALYVRIKLLTIHAKTLKNNVEMPDDALTGQFKFLMTKYYNADVHTSLSDVPDEYFL